MTTKDFTANVISASKVVPDGAFQNSAASGVWDINEALDLIKGGNWPTTGNFNPDTFVNALFSIQLYDGNSTADRAITNNINLSGKGGLVWTKCRSTAHGHALVDTANGAQKYLISEGTNALRTDSYAQEGITSFSSTGYVLGDDSGSDRFNRSSRTYVSWTFRKQPKFFDIQTWTGDGSSSRMINHNLGCEVGFIMAKRTDSTGDWMTYHRAPSSNGIIGPGINETGTPIATGVNTHHTTTQFKPSMVRDQVNTDANQHTGATYVAYLFAHNDDDGGFGEPGDQDIIKCGSYTGNGSATGPTVDLGFEPQFLMIKRAVGGSGSWEVVDTMRGFPVDTGGDAVIRWDSSGTENTGDALPVGKPTATGFQILTDEAHVNQNTHTYIYMAIRRGGMQTPTAASNVFAISTANGGSSISTGFDADFALSGRRVDFPNWYLGTRLTGNTKYLHSDVANTEGTYDGWVWNSPSGTFEQNMNNTDVIDYVWARARSYLDVVLYTGNATNNTEIKHNLGVVPEMVWTKQRTTDARDWAVYHSALGNTNTLTLNTNALAEDNSAGMHADPTASSIFLKSSNMVNANGQSYIAYLFATAAGVSKVGTFTQSGATNVDCGFSGSTPAFVLIKRTDASGDWVLFDSVRGIASGNDTSQVLNSSDAEVTNTDLIDPYSGGFATTSSITNGSYIFYAIAAIS